VRIENKGHISTLTFFNVSEKDYGNYTCVASNKLGNTNASITLYGECRKPGCSGPSPMGELEDLTRGEVMLCLAYVHSYAQLTTLDDKYSPCHFPGMRYSDVYKITDSSGF
jgi:hypothetical protein